MSDRTGVSGPVVSTVPAPTESASSPGRRQWPVAMGIGLALWAGSVILGMLTRDLVLVAPVVIIGSCVVPVTCTMAAFERRRRDGAHAVTVPMLVAAFVPGGVSALLLSIMIDVWFVRWPPGLLLPVVAVAETSAQLAIIAVLARKIRPYRTRDGLVLGAAVGFGFAAFETAGLAITTMVRPGASTSALLENIALRGVLAPFGHGLWAALVGGALFTAARHGRLRVSPALVGVFFTVVGLHLLWDLAPNLAATVVAGTTGSPVTWQAFDTAWIAGSTVRQANLVTTLTVVQLVLNAAVGAFLAARAWRRGGRDGAPRPAKGPG